MKTWYRNTADKLSRAFPDPFLLIGSARALSTQVGAAVIGLALHVLFARFLGPSGYGTYGLVMTWVAVLSAVALLGQSEASVRFIPRYVLNKAWPELRGFQRRIRLVVLAASSFLACLVLLCGLLFRSRLGGTLADALMAGALLLPLTTQLQLNGAMHRALKRAGSASIFTDIARPAAAIFLGLLFVVMLRVRLTPVLAIVLSGLGAVLALISAAYFLGKAWPPEAKNVEPKFVTREWMTSGRQLFSMALIGLVLNRVDVLLLSAFVPAAAVGPYYAAVQIAAIGAFGLNAINVVLAPMISECHAKGDLKELTQLTRRAAMLSLVATGAVTLGAVVLGEPVLEMFGPKFSQAYVPLLIILTGQVINAGCGPVGYLLTMTRYTHIAPRLFGTAALMNIGLSLLLIPRFGMYGAAAATATALVAWNLAALAFVLRYLKINPTIFGLASS